MVAQPEREEQPAQVLDVDHPERADRRLERGAGGAGAGVHVVLAERAQDAARRGARRVGQAQEAVELVGGLTGRGPRAGVDRGGRGGGVGAARSASAAGGDGLADVLALARGQRGEAQHPVGTQHHGVEHAVGPAGQRHDETGHPRAR
ncbi:hypothetical protein [Actinomycetospora sp. CA-053990]|uniref:hypothetical protein n=1 Tax=Actinomycetospora sp. CA-053990 TaxID=3239891 RepID=UPI003D9262B9